MKTLTRDSGIKSSFKNQYSGLNEWKCYEDYRHNHWCFQRGYYSTEKKVWSIGKEAHRRISRNNLERSTRRNNTEIQGIPSQIPNEKQKVQRESCWSFQWIEHIAMRFCARNLKLEKLINQRLVLSQMLNCMTENLNSLQPKFGLEM